MVKRLSLGDLRAIVESVDGDSDLLDSIVADAADELGVNVPRDVVEDLRTALATDAASGELPTRDECVAMMMGDEDTDFFSERYPNVARVLGSLWRLERR